MSAEPTDVGHDDERQRPGIIERLRNAFGLHSTTIREDIEEALEDERRPDGEFSAQERTILRNVLSLHELRVRDIMIPRADIVAIGVDAPLAEVLALFRTEGHSRLPAHGDTLDDPRGMVHIRDLVDYLAGRAEEADRRRREASGEDASAGVRAIAPEMIDLTVALSATGIVRPVLFIPPSMPALDLLVRMQATRTHMALVIDEYGGTDGLVSIEDVVEMIVGDIEDEHDETEAPTIVEAAPGVYVADGRTSLDDAEQATGWSLTDAEQPDIDTLGGLVASLAGRVPTRGEIVADAPGLLEFEVLEADPRRVKSLRLRRRAPPEEAD